MEKTYKWIYDDYMKKYNGKLGPKQVAPTGAHVKKHAAPAPAKQAGKVPAGAR
jgi:hypothetical protein